MKIPFPLRIALALIFGLSVSAAGSAAFFPSPGDWRDLTLYMIFTDRFADGDPTNNELTPGTTWRPDDPRGIHGGDFKGIEEHLDYIRALGARAIWITPVFLNDPSSAWHGYGAIDFSTISPQLGGLTGLQSLTRAAHKRGLYLILDVVVNHLGHVATSDDSGWPRFRTEGEGYRLRWVSPARMPAAPFNQLAWLHNRGQVQDWFDPTQAVVGQFFTLNDLATELPAVRAALARAYQELIRETDCDGFRVDTVRHVEESFWVPWCSDIRDYAQTLGKTNFLLFGEVALGNDQALARFTGPSAAKQRAFDSLLDYPLYYLLNAVLCTNGPTHLLTQRFAALTAPPYSTESTTRMVTFLDNHDQPRFLSSNKANADSARLMQAIALVYTMTGIPCLYYGTEQEFRGGNDPFNREDMIPPGAKGATNDHFQTHARLFQYVARLNAIRAAHPALRTGTQTVWLDDTNGAGLFVFERRRGKDAVVVTLNTAGEPRELALARTSFAPGTRLSRSLQHGEPWVTGLKTELPSLPIAPHSVEIWSTYAK